MLTKKEVNEQIRKKFKEARAWQNGYAAGYEAGMEDAMKAVDEIIPLPTGGPAASNIEGMNVEGMQPQPRPKKESQSIDLVASQGNYLGSNDAMLDAPTVGGLSADDLSALSDLPITL